MLEQEEIKHVEFLKEPLRTVAETLVHLWAHLRRVHHPPKPCPRGLWLSPLRSQRRQDHATPMKLSRTVGQDYSALQVRVSGLKTAGPRNLLKDAAGPARSRTTMR